SRAATVLLCFTAPPASHLYTLSLHDALPICAPFSFWSSSRIILILSFLLWWIPPAGPMIAGYVGGRRAGSPIKAVIAALMPVFAIYIANVTYAHNFASHPADLDRKSVV